MKKITYLFLSIASLVLFSCGSDDKKTENAVIVVKNNSSYTVKALYVASSDGTTWGTNQLGTSTIASGSTFTLTDVSPGTYDVAITTSTTDNPEKSTGANHTWIDYDSAIEEGMQYTYTLTDTNKAFTKSLIDSSEKAPESFGPYTESSDSDTVMEKMSK